MIQPIRQHEVAALPEEKKTSVAVKNPRRRRKPTAASAPLPPRARKKVAVVLEDVMVPKDDPEFRGRPENPSMEHDVIQALRALGHDVTLIGIFDQVDSMVAGLRAAEADVAFNLVEQFANDRRHDKNVAGLFEMMDIPFTGSGSNGLMFCRDKGLCKQLLRAAGLRVPDFHRFLIGEPIAAPDGLRYPVVVKPAFGDGSEGISNASLARDAAELEERVAFVQEKFQQDALAEEYIEGRELYVGVLGNTRLRVLPPYEVRFGSRDEGAPVLATYSVKWNKSYRDRWKIEFGFAEIDPAQQRRLAAACRKAYRVLQLQGYARIDLRLTPAGEIVLLEANPNPDITRGEEIAECARKAGLSYERFIQGIVRDALARAA